MAKSRQESSMARCARVREWLPEYDYGGPGVWQRWQVARHLGCCPECARELAGLRRATVLTTRRQNLPGHIWASRAGLAGWSAPSTGAPWPASGAGTGGRRRGSTGGGAGGVVSPTGARRASAGGLLCPLAPGAVAGAAVRAGRRDRHAGGAYRRGGGKMSQTRRRTPARPDAGEAGRLPLSGAWCCRHRR